MKYHTYEVYTESLSTGLVRTRTVRATSPEHAERMVGATLREAEGLEVSDEEVEAEYQSLADTYQMELEKVKALAGADSLRQDLLVRKAAKLVAEAAVPVAPKAEEEPKTEE